MVERQLPKLNVAGSNPVTRSKRYLAAAPSWAAVRVVTGHVSEPRSSIEHAFDMPLHDFPVLAYEGEGD